MSITQQIIAKKEVIEAWFEAQWREAKAPVYASVDLRDSGFKIAPVDTNLFPAGFNNLSILDQQFAINPAREIIHQWAPATQRLLIVAENHTRNVYYLEHLASLKKILENAGFEVKLSTLSADHYTTTVSSGKQLTLEVPTRVDNKLKIDEFAPDCILLNNDLSEGLPDLLTHLNQTIIPLPHLGWHQRFKSDYFEQYTRVCQAFMKMLGGDPWQLEALFLFHDQVNFITGQGRETLVAKSRELLAKITEKYQAYDSFQKPYIIVKADSGSYGMGVMAVENPEEFFKLPRKKRSHMMKTKGNRAIDRVILQEGVSTAVRWEGKIAEPVVYLFGSAVIGGFYRTHEMRNSQENLNAPGMALVPTTLNNQSNLVLSGENNHQWYVYGVVARLAVLAASFEGSELNQ